MIQFFCLVFFGFLVILGIVKNNKWIICASISILLFLIIDYFFLEPKRSYIKTWGEPTGNCIKVLNHQTPTIPIIDFACVYHVNTCPDEVRRLLSQHEFEKEILNSNKLFPKSVGISLHWYRPEQLGDSVYMFTYREQYGRGIVIYTNSSMTEAYFIKFIN